MNRSTSGRNARFDEARELVPLVDASDVDVMVALVREMKDPGVAAEWISTMWRRAPARASNEAVDALVEGRSSAHGWFHLAPRTALKALADAVEGLTVPPPWAQQWAFARMLGAGNAAEQLFRLSGAGGGSGGKQGRGAPGA